MVCPRCHGERGEQLEDGWMPCYHCGATGKIPDEALRDTKIEALIGALASALIDAWDRQPPYPEDDVIELAAGEMMMTVAEYRQMQHIDWEQRMGRVMAEVEKLPDAAYFVNAMLYLVDNMSREIERLRYPEEPPKEPLPLLPPGSSSTGEEEAPSLVHDDPFADE